MSANPSISTADKLSIKVNAGIAREYLKISDSSRLIGREMIEPSFSTSALRKSRGYRRFLRSISFLNFDHSRFHNVSEASLYLPAFIVCRGYHKLSDHLRISSRAKQNVVFGKNRLWYPHVGLFDFYSPLVEPLIVIISRRGLELCVFLMGCPALKPTAFATSRPDRLRGSPTR
jgi:hypothetical protein